MRIEEFSPNHVSRRCVRACMMSSAYELKWALKMYEETCMAWCILYFNKGKYRNVLLANMRVKLQNVTFASEHVREPSAFGVGRQKQETVHLWDKTEVSYQVLKQNIRKIWTKRGNQNILLRKPRTRLKSSTRPRVLNNWILRSWSTPVFHVSALTCGVYESEQNPVNQDLACCLSV